MDARAIFALAGIALLLWAVVNKKVRIEVKEFKFFGEEALTRPQRITVGLLGVICFVIASFSILKESLPVPAAAPVAGAGSTSLLLPTSTSTPSLHPTQVSTSATAPQPTLSPTDAPLTPIAITTAGPEVGPLLDILPQAVDGELFQFAPEAGLLTAEIVEDADCLHSGQYGLHLTYNFTGDKSGGWGVHWAKAPEHHFDASQFTALIFWVKGTARQGFNVGLKDTNEKESGLNSQTYVVVSGTNWRLVSMPLDKFGDKNGRVNIASLENISFGFNKAHGSGSICIDDIAFVK